MEWPKENALRLIEMYRNHPVLWNCKNVFYRDRNKRNDALSEIAVSLGVIKEEVERKIKNLCCHFSREVKKERDTWETGTDINEVYKSKWFAYGSMAFLRDKNKLREIKDREFEIEDVKLVSQDIEEMENSKNLAITYGKWPKNDFAITRKLKKYISKKKHTIPTKKPRTTNPLANKAYMMMKSIYSHKEGRDEYSLFGEQVAMKIRKLPTEHAKVVVQQIINTTLFSAALGKYNSPDLSQICPVFPYDVQCFAHLQSQTLLDHKLAAAHDCSHEELQIFKHHSIPAPSPSPESSSSLELYTVSPAISDILQSQPPTFSKANKVNKH